MTPAHRSPILAGGARGVYCGLVPAQPRQTEGQYATSKREGLAAGLLLRGPDSWARASEERQTASHLPGLGAGGADLVIRRGPKGTTAARLSGQERGHLGQSTLLVWSPNPPPPQPG